MKLFYIFHERIPKLLLFMSIDYESLHQQIMDLDLSIRLVTICTNDGQIIYSDHREGVRNLLTPEESKKSLELAITADSTYDNLMLSILMADHVILKLAIM
jgi:hypothetical protein